MTHSKGMLEFDLDVYLFILGKLPEHVLNKGAVLRHSTHPDPQTRVRIAPKLQLYVLQPIVPPRRPLFPDPDLSKRQIDIVDHSHAFRGWDPEGL